MIVWEALRVGGKYNPVTNSWLKVSTGSNAPSQRRGSNAIWTGDEMIIWGGDGGGCCTNDGGRYFPDSDAWLATGFGHSVPDPRSGHTVVWTGDQMIIWGGGTDNSVRNGGIYTSGAAYSPGNSLRGKKTPYITLNWSSVYGTGSYSVKRCNPTATGCTPGMVISTPTINQYSEPDDGISHFYSIEAVNQCGATP